MKQGESENWQLLIEPLVFKYQNVCCVQKHELLHPQWKEKNEVIVKGATSLTLVRLWAHSFTEHQGYLY